MSSRGTTGWFSLVLVAACLVVAGPARAVDFSFTGSFAQDDNHQLFGFVVGAPSNVTLRTWSYAGGTNAAGQVIARGGFDPILAVFDSTGVQIGENDDGDCGLVAPDANTGECWDTFLTVALGPGSYFTSVAEFDNFNNGSIAAGWFHDGQGNFTAGFGCPDEQPAFNDVSGVLNGCGRDSHWAFDILNVADAVVVTPEPGSPILLLAFALAGLLLRRRRPR